MGAPVAPGGAERVPSWRTRRRSTSSQMVAGGGRDGSVGCLVGVASARFEQAGTAAQRVAGPVRREVEMQVRHMVAEHIDIHLVRACGLPKRTRDGGQGRAERGRFWAVEIGDEGDMAFGFQVSEARD